MIWSTWFDNQLGVFPRHKVGISGLKSDSLRIVPHLNWLALAICHKFNYQFISRQLSQPQVLTMIQYLYCRGQMKCKERDVANQLDRRRDRRCLH